MQIQRLLNVLNTFKLFQIAPPTPAFDNFIYHWEKFIVNYLEWTSDGKYTEIHVDQTKVSGHLEIVLQVVLIKNIYL